MPRPVAAPLLSSPEPCPGPQPCSVSKPLCVRSPDPVAATLSDASALVKLSQNLPEEEGIPVAFSPWHVLLALRDPCGQAAGNSQRAQRGQCVAGSSTVCKAQRGQPLPLWSFGDDV